MRTVKHPRFGVVEVLDESPNLVRIAHPEHGYEFWLPKKELEGGPAAREGAPR